MSTFNNNLFGHGAGVDRDTLKTFLDPAFIADRISSAMLRNAIVDQNFQDIDLTNKFSRPWHARHQKRRNTCIAFANAACVELLLAASGQSTGKMSPEFLYWNMRNDSTIINTALDGWNIGSSNSRQAELVLNKFGICLERDLPYNFNTSLGEEKEPGVNVFEKALEIRGTRATEDSYYAHKDGVADDIALRIYSKLKNGIPIVMGIPMYRFSNDAIGNTNWTNTRTLNSGVVFGPGEGVYENQKTPLDLVGHAVCVTGFQVDPGAPGGGWFIFRNSWGRDFGVHSNRDPNERPFFKLPGFGALSFNYANLCWEILGLKLI